MIRERFRERFVIRNKKVLIIFSVMATTSDPRYDWCGITGNKLSGVVDILVRYFSGDALLVGEILHPFLFVCRGDHQTIKGRRW